MADNSRTGFLSLQMLRGPSARRGSDIGILVTMTAVANGDQNSSKQQGQLSPSPS
jgi:hypothetical protein